MNADAPDVVRWLLLVGAVLLAAVLAGLVQRHWRQGGDTLSGPAAHR